MISTRTIRNRTVAMIALLALALVSTACAEKSTDQLIADARQEREKGSYKSAVVHLKTALQKSPDNAEARYLLGATYVDMSEAYAAEIELRRAIDLGHEQARVAIGKPLLLLGSYQKVLDQVPLRTDLDSAVQAEILTLRGRALLALGRRDEGREALDQALVKQPEFPDALLAHAHYAAWERKADEAGTLIERALAIAPKNVDGWLMKGDLARFKGDPAGALAAYEKILEFNPENVPARLNIASLQIGSGRFDDARKQLAQVRNLAPKLILTKYLTALIDFREKKFTAARDAVMQVLKVAPEHLPSVLLAGTVESALGAHAQAQKHLGKIVERAPGYLPARKLLVASLIKSGHVQRAIDVLQPGLERAPNDVDLLGMAGELHLQRNELAKAVQYFEKATKIDPKSAGARAGLAMSRLATGETERALADLESAVEMDPDRYQADVLLVTSHLQRGSYDQALKALESLEKKQPKNPLTYNLKGAAYLGKKDYASARKHFEHALELNPLSTAAAKNLAQLDLHDKKPEAARRRLEAILEKDNDNTDALMGLATLAPQIGATSKELIDWLERARKASPRWVQPQLMLARAYAQSGDPKRGLEIAQRAQTAHPEDPEVLDFLATMQYGTGAKEQALATYGKLVALQPKSPGALYWLAMAQAANNNFAVAASTLRKAVELKPDFLVAQAELVGLELRTGRPAEAMKIAKQVQKQNPKLSLGFSLEGDVLMAEQKHRQAAEAYEAAYGMGKNGSHVVKLHAALVAAGKPAEAEERLTQGVQEFSNDSRVRTYAAEVALRGGNYRSAIEHYEWLTEKHPDNLLYLNNLAWTYQQVKDARALETAERAYKLGPANATVADTLGWMLVEQGNVKRGVELLQKAAAAAPMVSLIRFHFAQALVKAGDRARARQELVKLLAEIPNSPHAAEAKQLLADLSPRQ